MLIDQFNISNYIFKRNALWLKTVGFSLSLVFVSGFQVMVYRNIVGYVLYHDFIMWLCAYFRRCLAPSFLMKLHVCGAARVWPPTAMVAKWLRGPTVIQSGHLSGSARLWRVWYLESPFWLPSHRLTHRPSNTGKVRVALLFVFVNAFTFF